ncbi:MAG: SphA family protein, partial [Paracoccaceae bacterium]
TLLMFPPVTALAVEGGTGTYLLGSRDSLAGIAPPPGTYVTADFVHLDGNVKFMALGGVPLVDTHTKADLLKLNATFSFDTTLWGGQPALTVTLPVISGDLTFDGSLASGLSQTFSDSNSGIGDLTVTPMLGWARGNHHWLVAASLFFPTGEYDTATVNIPDRQIKVANLGKNRFAFDPVVAYTYLDPTTGREFSAVGGVTFSAENDATDYQTAPEAHLELTAMQYLPNRLGLGLTGYAYKQLGDDSGAGADAIRFATGQDSLQAEVYGIGPLITYSTKVGDRSVSMKLKYLHEFSARKRFESDVVTASVNFSF